MESFFLGKLLCASMFRALPLLLLSLSISLSFPLPLHFSVFHSYLLFSLSHFLRVACSFEFTREQRCLFPFPSDGFYAVLRRSCTTLHFPSVRTAPLQHFFLFAHFASKSRGAFGGGRSGTAICNAKLMGGSPLEGAWREADLVGAARLYAANICGEARRPSKRSAPR